MAQNHAGVKRKNEDFINKNRVSFRKLLKLKFSTADVHAEPTSWQITLHSGYNFIDHMWNIHYCCISNQA